ncbi:hypothetical protein ABL78_6206 [Leptomonas seymouri]|uniref:Uncharacterized protein n=1 Tax=Leptomonas seymouri TaxID=5684 RepID=A0A0N0P405_LEPSE|nr:hypothetical protein ABL78_6206 [Leptomonas seymouri]|eukprot:KPI84739.1 hypothetical protein ABL78_6206 [Leptomonas seymouri]
MPVSQVNRSRRCSRGRIRSGACNALRFVVPLLVMLCLSTLALSHVETAQTGDSPVTAVSSSSVAVAAHDDAAQIVADATASVSSGAHTAEPVPDATPTGADKGLPEKAFDAENVAFSEGAGNAAACAGSNECSAPLKHLRQDGTTEMAEEQLGLGVSDPPSGSTVAASNNASHTEMAALCDGTAVAEESITQCNGGVHASEASEKRTGFAVNEPAVHVGEERGLHASPPTQESAVSSPVLDTTTTTTIRDALHSSEDFQAPQDQAAPLLDGTDNALESHARNEGAADPMDWNSSSRLTSEAPAAASSSGLSELAASAQHGNVPMPQQTEAEVDSTTHEHSEAIADPAPVSSEHAGAAEQEGLPASLLLERTASPNAAVEEPTEGDAPSKPPAVPDTKVDEVKTDAGSYAPGAAPELFPPTEERSSTDPTDSVSPQIAEPVAPQVFSSVDTDRSGDIPAPAAAAADPRQGSDNMRNNASPLKKDGPDTSSSLASALKSLSTDPKHKGANMEVSAATPVPRPPFIEAQPRRPKAQPSRLALSYLYYHALEALYVEENVTLFVHRARDAAPYGHARLNWLLGVLHAYGIGVPRSEREALMYYSFAVMEGVPEAHMALGYRYRYALGVNSSCEMALAHYREAADGVAMTYDGSTVDLEGSSVTELSGSRTILSGGGRRGILSLFSYRQDSIMLRNTKHVQQDLLSLIYEADRGSGQALLLLGYIYLKGSSTVRRDGRKAEAYLRQAAEMGIPEAHGALGSLYFSGEASTDPPLQRDLVYAHHHYSIGAAMGDAVSLNGLGFLYAIGYIKDDKVAQPANVEGGPSDPSLDFGFHPYHPDFAKAARLFEQSKSTEGTYNLAVLYLYGRGVKQDRALAQQLFLKAAHRGSVLAQWQLAHLIDENSEGRLSECVKASELYRETASYGSWHRGDTGGRGGGLGATRAASTSFFRSSFLASLRGFHTDDAEGAHSSDADSYSEAAAGRRQHSGDDEKRETTASSDTDDISADGRSKGGAGQWQQSDVGSGEDSDGLSAPRTSADYERLLGRVRRRLHTVEEGLRLSDSGEGPAVLSLATFVELLSLTEVGDAESAWLAAKFVDDYLEVQGEKAEPVKGEVTLMWPSTTAARPSPETGSAAPFLSPAEARSKLLFYLLQRTVLNEKQKRDIYGAAYLRLGDLFYYGEAPQHGVDMARAMKYYLIAADVHHNPQALFNVGFMYQLGLHKAPRATLVSSKDFATELPAMRGVVWKVHSTPPHFLTSAPSMFLTGKAVAHAWNRDSVHPTSRAVDVYMAWMYYTESLKREAQGWMAVRFALMTLNLQWSLRHFGLSGTIQGPHQGSSSFSSSRGKPSPMPGSGNAGGASAGAGITADESFLKPFTDAAYEEAMVLYSELSGMVTSLWAWYWRVEQAVLYGSISVFTLALLVRHQAL